MPYELLPVYKPYPWGDPGYIQELFDLPDLSGKPLAEAWLGAHPASPSPVVSETGMFSLDKMIAADPIFNLGKADTLFNHQLPFLLKVLAAAKPLSIQVHPNKAAAKRGFQAENEAGLSLADPRRNFKDSNHKPELLCALTPFTLLCGFQAYNEIINNFRVFHLEHIWTEFAPFMANPSSVTLKKLFSQILSYSAEQADMVVQQIITCKAPGAESMVSLCQKLHRHYPHDIGIISPLLMNRLALVSGEAIYLQPGTLHTYIRGAGIEIMANSDNVIRAGLTSKHVDLESLMDIASFDPNSPKLITPPIRTNEVVNYPAPPAEFKLGILLLEGDLNYATDDCPTIILCLEGTVYISNNIILRKGQAAYIPAGECAVLFSGIAKLIIATTN